MLLRTSLLVLTLAVSSCSSTPQAPDRLDDAMLSELSPAAMAGVVEARATKDAADDAHAKAKRDTQWAEEQVGLSRSALDVARAEVNEAKLALAVADKSGTGRQLDAASATYDYRLARSDQARELLALRKRELDVSRLREKLALEQLRLNSARVELEKAQAVQELDRVAARRVPVKDHQKQVRYHETEAELARVRLNAAEIELQEAQVEYELIRQAAESKKPAGMENR